MAAPGAPGREPASLASAEPAPLLRRLSFPAPACGLRGLPSWRSRSPPGTCRPLTGRPLETLRLRPHVRLGRGERCGSSRFVVRRRRQAPPPRCWPQGRGAIPALPYAANGVASGTATPPRPFWVHAAVGGRSGWSRLPLRPPDPGWALLFALGGGGGYLLKMDWFSKSSHHLIGPHDQKYHVELIQCQCQG